MLGLGCQGTIEVPIDPIANLPPTCQDPGHVTLRRLNRTEYNNTVRDLLGDTTLPANEFPADPSASFDNNGDVLAASPLLVEQWEATAAKVVDAALAPPPMPIAVTHEAEALAQAMCVGGTEPPGSDYTCFGFQNTTSPTSVVMWEHDWYLDRMESLQSDGDYRLSVRVFKAGTVNAKLAVLVDGKAVVQRDVTAAKAAPETVTMNVTLARGVHRIQIRNTNTARAYERDLGVDFLKIEGPTNAPSPTREAFRAKVFSCDPAKEGVEACARKILTPFARQAYRRPVTEEDLAKLLPQVQLAISKGDDFQAGIRLAMKRVLTSADFLFKVETDVSPDTPAVHALDDHELATRLAYFLWASMPDEELMRVADEGRLNDLATLEAQARRMIEDPKAEALVESFASQWLKLRALNPASPAAEVYPSFDQALKSAMREETTLFARTFVREDKSVLELLDAKYTFLNERLAQHYGIAGVTGPDLKRVELSTNQRGGILGHGAMLTLTSAPNRTSPVRRGNWVLAQLWCDEPPPPPPNVPALPEGQSTEGKTLRQLAEIHRKDPRCASCHTSTDPIGFALETYDGVGTYRTMEGTLPIDASGELPDGRKFNGPTELAQVVKADPQFPRCVSRKLLTYAIGRELTAADDCTLDAVVEALKLKNYRLKELAVQVVKTPQFRTRRGATPVGGAP